MKLLFVFFTVFSIMIVVGAIIYSELKNKDHKSLCNDFYEAYHYIPKDILYFREGGIFFTFQKDIYFLISIIFNKDSFFLRNLDENIFIFIKEQPKDKILWIVIKFSILGVGIGLIIINYIIYEFFLKDL